MTFFAISKFQIFIALIVILFAFQFSFLLGGVSFIIFGAFLIFLRRRKFENLPKDYLDNNIFLSPVTGWVKEIKKK